MKILYETCMVIHAAITFFLVAFLLTLFVLWIFSDAFDKKELISGYMDHWKTIILFLFIIGLFFYGLYKLENISTTSELTATEHIIAIGDSNDTNSKMYLRRGNISTELWYHYYVDLGEGFVANRVKASNATLYYTDDNYRVEWYKHKKRWLWFYAEETKHKIYIPEGSIVEDFNLDLQ